LRRLLIATTNTGKLREIGDVLDGLPIELMTLADLPAAEEPEETGESFRENARLKALYYAAHADVHARGSVAGFDRQPATPLLTVAEDSGLVVDALEGEPGVRSARFLGPDAGYPVRFAEILRRLDERPDRPRTARFVCALAAARDGRIVFEADGVVEGEIAAAPVGSAGFGYDPIFYFPPYGATLAEVSQQQKLRVAHRGRAFRSFAEWLKAEWLKEKKV
jgi:XTP/dITP diphosphohydrolase